jgi:predicted short-subunit dehydrogenase-like oxidoreductase (DUF2520 family)
MSTLTPADTRRLPVVICGAGRVGLSLAAGLSDSGWPVARFLLGDGTSTRAGFPLPATAEPEISLARWRPPRDPHILFLAVPDDALQSVTENLRQRFSIQSGSGWMALHTSGVHDSTILDPLRRCAFAVGSWHPVQTFPKPEASRFRDIPVTVEGDSIAMDWGRAVARQLGAHPVPINADSKKLFHCLCTISSSHVAALPLFCHEAMRSLPAEDRELLWAALLNLSQNTLRNMVESPEPHLSVTGPVARGDRQTLALHMETLARSFPEWRPIYELLSRYLEKHLLNR